MIDRPRQFYDALRVAFSGRCYARPVGDRRVVLERFPGTVPSEVAVCLVCTFRTPRCLQVMFENPKGLAAPVSEDWLQRTCGPQKVILRYFRYKNVSRSPQLQRQKIRAHCRYLNWDFRERKATF